MSPRLSFALLWALMLHLSLVLFLVAAPDPRPQGAEGQGAGVELQLGEVAPASAEAPPTPVPEPPSREPVRDPETPQPVKSEPTPVPVAPLAVEQSKPKTVVEAPSRPKPKPEVPQPQPRAEPVPATAAIKPPPQTVAPPTQAPSRAPGGNGGDRYLAQLRSHLAGYRPAYTAHYGVAQVRFRIAASGAVSGVRVVESDGGEALAGEALALILRAAPMPVPPNGRPLELVVPIEFR
ncbi:TonB family protein [Algiphilus sp. W345]|uniref:TonB family protein n=1 Tax=Banduia mediterranea TaxID=3075609 RepID=A0ABU2WE03_9GAMM|nr:TonB family protein [Algiphilus sp. W345]MDT0496101.1 TonB family protein [Algiphilus sp. W345]